FPVAGRTGLGKWHGISKVPEFPLAPIGHEDIEFVTSGRAIVGGEHELPAIRREFRESREPAELGHLLKTGAVEIDQVQFEFPAVAVMFIGREENLFAVRRKGGGKAGA